MVWMKNQEIVKDFIQAIKNNDLKEISKFVGYPLSRHTPIPAIDNEQEFIERFHEVFDDELIGLIINSKIDDDWHAVGWRGIMLKNGELWLEYDGKVKAVNHQSKYEQKKSAEIIESIKSKLHDSLRQFLEPVLEWETENYRVRIDRTGENNYRYASWSVNAATSEKPDLILRNGKWMPDGSGGNHYYEFTNGIYSYKCYVIILGTEESPQGTLEVFRNETQILYEPVVKIIKP